MLIVTAAVSNLIREAKTFQIPSMMQVGKAVGMVTLNDALLDLVTKKLVAPEEAYAKAVDKTGFEALLKRAGSRRRSPRLEPRRRRSRPRRAAATGPADSRRDRRAVVVAVARSREARAIFVRFCWS